jgi:hypothetical protein
VVEQAYAAAAFAVSYLGFAALALRQRSHHSAVTGSTRRAPPAAALRQRHLLLGCCALALSLVLSWLSQRPSFGSILFSFALSAGALGVMFTLTYCPRWLRPLQRAVAIREG